MTYGNYNFSPVPYLRLGLQANRLGNGTVVGFTWTAALSGDLLDTDGGIIDVDALQDTLSSAIYMQPQGSRFYLECSSVPLLDVYPAVLSLSFEQGNWVNRSPYTIDMEFNTLASGIGDYISDYKEDWAFEFVEDKSGGTWATLLAANSNGQLVADTVDYLHFQARITHSVSATGKTIYDTLGMVKPAYQQARSFVNARLVASPDAEFVENSGCINLFPVSMSGQYLNHVRTVNTDETAGTYAVNENWLLITNSGGWIGNATEDFTIDIRTTADTPYRSVSIQGSIQGLETRSYGSVPGDFVVSETKYQAANTYWGTVSNRLYARCKQLSGYSINPIPLSTTNGYNPYTGTITYTNDYNTRPSNCLLKNGSPVTTEIINLTDNNGGDLFASVFVLGKTSGPVLQSLNTRSARTRSLSIETVILPSSICPSGLTSIASLIGSCKPDNADALVDMFEADLSGNRGATQIFRGEDNETMNLKDGRYSRTVGWTFGYC